MSLQRLSLPNSQPLAKQIMEIPDISREEILEVVSNKLIETHFSHYSDDFCNQADAFTEVVSKRIEDKVSALVPKNLEEVISKALNDAMQSILDETVQPVDIFGDRKGEPTTIRQALADRAKAYWLEKIDSNGRPCGRYGGGQPRCEVMLKEHLKDAFTVAIGENRNEIISSLRAALKETALQEVEKNLGRLFR